MSKATEFDDADAVSPIWIDEDLGVAIDVSEIQGLSLEICSVKVFLRHRDRIISIDHDAPGLEARLARAKATFRSISTRMVEYADY